MTAVAIDALLVLAVLACWLGAAGFARLRSPLDRLHCVTFINVAAGLAVFIASFIADGASNRVLKIGMLIAAVLFVGAALAHASGRALLLRATQR